MATKFCKDCQDYRPVSEFSRNARTRDGLAFYCKKHLSERSLRSREARRVKPRTLRQAPRDLVIPDEHKWCPDCGSVLPLTDFVRSVASATGYSSYCKPCHNTRSRRSRDKVGGSRSYHLTRRYGITAAEADFLLEQQRGLCAICQKATATHVDHDHATGSVRELLCFNCNGGLGQFKDDPAVLRAAAEYVERHRARQEKETSGSRPVGASRPGAPPVGSKRHPGMPRHVLCSRGRARLAELERAYREADG